MASPITYTGDLIGFNYDAILRDKQKFQNIQSLFQLSDYYIDADPIYRGIIKQVYTPFSVADQYRLIGENEEVKQKYMAYYERIELEDTMESIFYQYFKYANVYVYLMPDGRLITLAPHMVRISGVQVNGEPVVQYHCGDLSSGMENQNAKRDYIQDQEEEVRLKGLPPEVAEGVKDRQEWVQLNPENTFVLQDTKEDWMRYAVPLIASCLKALRKKEIISKWEDACLNLGMRSFVHVTYGDPDGRVLPNTEQLNAVTRMFRQAMTGSALAVTNHWAKAAFIQPDLDEMFTSDKYKSVNADILSAGGISGILVSGISADGSTYATAQVSMQTAAIRIRKARNSFCQMMNKINKRLNNTGNGILPHSKEDNIPKFTFPPVDLAGSKQFQEACFKLWSEGMVSLETLLTSYGLDIDQEKERKGKEESDGTMLLLSNIPKELAAQQAAQEEDGMETEAPEGKAPYVRNGRTYWRSKRTAPQEEEPEGTNRGRPTMDDGERSSDPYRSETGRQPKPSNPKGSEAQK